MPPSHSQATGGDQANAIYLELERMGFKAWYDNRASDLTKEGMLAGINDEMRARLGLPVQDV